MGVNLTQNETRDLLDVIVTIVEEERMNAGQKFELAKRRINDADKPHDRKVATAAKDFWEVLEKKYLELAGKINDVIVDECGDDWRDRG